MTHRHSTLALATLACLMGASAEGSTGSGIGNATAAASTTPTGALTAEQKFAKLSEYDFILVIDKSGSMGDPNKESAPTGPSRWQYMQESAMAFTREICKIDSDGIGIVLFSGSGITTYDGCTPEKVKEIFATNRPSGSTPLAEGLTEALKLVHKSSKKAFVTVFTDGVPDDGAKAEKVIVDQSNSQAKDEDCTFLFAQVGDNRDATAYLQKLDDKLTCKFDIVDAKTIDQMDQYASVLDLVLDAIND